MRPASLIGFVVAMACVAAAPLPPPRNPAVRALQLFEAGVKQQRGGQSVQAIATLTNAINSHALEGANAARAVFDRGLAYDSLGNAKAAIGDYTEALRRDPSLSAAYNNRGNAYRRNGLVEYAKRDYLAALSIKGGAQQYPYYGLGLIAVQAGDQDGARAYFHKALAADPGFRLAAHNLAALNGKTAKKTIALSVPPVAQKQPSVAEVHLRPAINDAGSAAVIVQLGAFRDEGSAKAGWSKAITAAGTALDGLKPVITTVDLPGKGRFWRLRVALSGKLTARTLCTRLVDKGQGCIVATY